MDEHYYALFSNATGAYQGGIGFFASEEEAEESAGARGMLDDNVYVAEADWASH